MGTLQGRLDRIKSAFRAEAPPEALAIIDRAAAELEASELRDRVAAAGGPLPPFELTDTDGQTVRSADLLARGPLVVTVYRGLW